MSTPEIGAICTRLKDGQARGLTPLPGSEYLPCSECEETVVLSPSMQQPRPVRVVCSHCAASVLADQLLAGNGVAILSPTEAHLADVDELDRLNPGETSS